MLRKGRFGLAVTANITDFDFDDSMFNVITIIVVNDSSQTVNYALCDADASRSFSAVPYSEIMPIIKTSKRRVVECGRHSKPDVSFPRKGNYRIWQYSQEIIYALPDLTAVSVSGRHAQNVHALKT